MTFDISMIKSMWEKDSQIDMDNLHQESINIPVLHSKYYDIYNNLLLLKAKAEQQRKNVRHERYEYYSGKADPDVYQKDPFPKKVRDKDAMNKYLDADKKLSTISMKIEYYQVMINYVDSILKQISNRTYQIKNSIEFLKFQAGYG
ncbi:UvsY-like recombination mediator [Synechococcus phage S-SCSM1]|uniref:UsvY n=1 Tax=Synechococcus phage S-SCSM1 TaxID=2588487 RepID=A0A6M2ZHR5_9CAUD|nr:UvsY-like recombination mediator [Synechococcus phage S-SCSM1]QFG06303.2 UsvY [Synechococcus phage S-SCSM1]